MTAPGTFPPPKRRRRDRLVINRYDVDRAIAEALERIELNVDRRIDAVLRAAPAQREFNNRSLGQRWGALARALGQPPIGV